MTTFPGREQAFEAKFAHDEEFKFLMTGRRGRLFAGWAAKRLHLSEPARMDLLAAVLHLRDGTGHDDLLLRCVVDTFERHRHLASRTELAAALERCHAEARQQLIAGPSDAPVGRTSPA